MIRTPTRTTRKTIRLTPRGQIFIPEAGTYKFKDGVDDYTYLVIDGDVLLDDNNWTGPTGSDNGGSPIVEKTFDEAGWYDFTFRMAEGGGGDAGTLYWDYNNADFPAGQTDPAGTGALIPAENFRSVDFRGRRRAERLLDHERRSPDGRCRQHADGHAGHVGPRHGQRRSPRSSSWCRSRVRSCCA